MQIALEVLSQGLLVIVYLYSTWNGGSQMVRVGFDANTPQEKKVVSWYALCCVLYVIPLALVNCEGQRILDADDKLRAVLESLLRTKKRKTFEGILFGKEVMTHRADKQGRKACPENAWQLEHIRNNDGIPGIEDIRSLLDSDRLSVTAFGFFPVSKANLTTVCDTFTDGQLTVDFGQVIVATPRAESTGYQPRHLNFLKRVQLR
jgi:hypothetical protein